MSLNKSIKQEKTGESPPKSPGTGSVPRPAVTSPPPESSFATATNPTPFQSVTKMSPAPSNSSSIERIQTTAGQGMSNVWPLYFQYILTMAYMNHFYRIIFVLVREVKFIVLAQMEYLIIIIVRRRGIKKRKSD